MSELQYLFDTNILSALIKQPAGALAHKISSLDDELFCTSIIVACELRYGASKNGSRRLINKVNSLLSNIRVITLGDEVDQCYAFLRTYLDKNGQPISAHDMFIAAHALTLDVTLITANEREFKEVPKLKVENWL